MRIRLSLKLWLVLTLLLIVLVPSATVLADETVWAYDVMVPFVGMNYLPSNQPPAVPVVVLPADGAMGVRASVTELQWYASDPDGHPLTFDIYLEENDATPDVLIAQDVSGFSYLYQGWGQTNYYWYVVAKDPYGGETAGPVAHFSTGLCDLTLDIDVPEVTGQHVTVRGDVISPCANVTRINFDWGDNTDNNSSLPAVHTYPEAAGYTIKVTAWNDQGMSTSETIRMYAGPPSGICPYVTQIDEAECEALVAIYEANGGPTWDVEPGWMVLTDPCVNEWEGVWCEDDHVSKLYFADKGLTGVLPGEIETLLYLKELDLHDNAITGLPWQIGLLAKLENLRIDETLISALPPHMGWLNNLQSLQVQYNANLTGPIPDFLSTMENVSTFNYAYTNWCLPVTGPVPEWLSGVQNVTGNGVYCTP